MRDAWRVSSWRVSVAALIVAALVGAAVGPMQRVPWVPIALFMLFLLLAVVARLVFGPVMLSPVQFVGLSLVILGFAGRLLYQAVAHAPGGAGVRLDLSLSLSERTMLLFLTAGVCVLAGGLLYAVVRGYSARYETTMVHRVHATRTVETLMLVGATIPVIAMVLWRGESLWHRAFYIESHVTSQGLWALVGPAAVAGVTALGYLWGTKSNRLLLAVLLLAYVVVLLGTGSRRLAMIPSAFAVGFFFARPDLRAKILLGIFILASFYLLELPLRLRQLPEHGIQPYVTHLPSLFGGGMPIEASVLNILVSYAITGTTAFGQVPFPVQDLWVSVNPVPGDFTGWYQIAGAHRLNTYTPYAGLGELQNVGWAATIIGCILLGVVLGHLDAQSKAWIRRGLPIVGLMLVALGGLFTLMFVQYNLRTAARMLYYAIAIDLTAMFWVWFRDFLRRRIAGGTLVRGAGRHVHI